MNAMNKTSRLHIRILALLLLLLLGGMSNEAWAAKVTYHILTKPFDVRNHNNSGDYKTNIRVEALQCTSEEAFVGLPDQFKSPLATNFQYWGTVDESSLSYDSLYDYAHNSNVISAKYNIYQCGKDKSVDNWEYACLSTPLTEGDPVGAYTDIYVTYDYDSSNGIVDLNGGMYYNISVDMSGTLKFMCLNRSRNNRVSNAKASVLTGEYLADNDFVVPENGKQELGWPWGSGDNKIWGPKGIHLGFKFLGEDPYNITIMTSYTGDEVHVTDAITGVDSKATIKPFKDATLFGKMGNNQMWFDVSNDRHYKIQSGMSNSDVDLKTGNYKNPAKYDECKTTYTNAANDAARYETWVGFYRKEYYAELTSYALLPNTSGDYLFVASKLNMGTKDSKAPTINQPNSSKYYVYNDNGNQPHFALKTLNNAYKTKFYAIRTYTVHVTTKGSSTPLSATMKWSDAKLDDAIVDHIPDVIKRKYVNYTAYSDAAHNKPVTSFKDIQDANVGKDPFNNFDIYLDYTVSENIPFKLLPTTGAGSNYQNAQWYTMRMDGVANPKYIAYEGTSNALVVTDGSDNPKGSNTASQIHQGENSAEAMVTFMGDPYELRILNRKACEDAGGNVFIGCSSASDTDLSTNMTGSSDISTWEIVYESTGVTGMLLRQFKTAGSTPKYIGLSTATNNKPVTYSGTASRIRVVELEKKKYAFHIMRADFSIAVMATTMEEVGKRLKGNYTDIPEIIRSSYLSSATVNFYATQADATSNTANKITNLPYDGSATGTYADVWVRYSVTPPASTDYNVRVNNDYIYTSGEAIGSKPSITDDEAKTGAYQWRFDFTDPYALTIYNVGLGSTQFMNVSFSDQASITWSATPSHFIAKSGNTPGTYEVMAATGDDVDASKTYYNIGRPATNTVKLYSNSSYLSGNATLRFQLSATEATDVTYHLVDMYNNVLLDATTRQSTTEDLPAFPPQYYSPLVDKYYYHKDLLHAQGNRTTNQYAEGEKVGQAEVWVTYDVNDLVDMKAGQMYLLKYEAGQEFRQEDGSDGLLPAKTPAEIAAMTEEEKEAYVNTYKAVYPYCNGDGNFFVYGQEQYDIQQQGASSTRTRWAWYVESNVEGAPMGDPYHVMIKSRQTESYPITNSSEYNAYFMTYKPDGYDKVVTTLGWPGMNSETATEYMVLGSEGQYQLVTSYEIGGSRYVVNSFEQYWKTWDTIRKKVYGESGAKENDSEAIIIPNDTKAEFGVSTSQLLRDHLKDDLGWHSYEKWAYAKRWNGYNNGYSSTEGTHEKKKGWERVEHWYQTINMSQGYFNFVKTEINPVLILLDQHGWEIMRKPIPTDPEDPLKDAKYEAIRPYNSPMVKEYAFWATAKKRTGFHQYYLMSDRIGGDDFTSTDLTSLPPYGSKNVKDKKGNLNDQYVTYIVKDEYAQTYTPSSQTGKPFLIEQGTDHKYATIDETSLTASAIPHDGDMMAHILNDNIPATEQWYVKPNVNIDIEMGYNDAAHTWTNKKANGSWDNKNPNSYEHKDYKNELVASYITDTKLTDSLGYFSFSNGFDPYNIQISTVSESTELKFMKTNANGATIEEGSLIGSYPTNPGTISMGDDATPYKTDSDPKKPKWYDSRNLDVTNATFMAVQDAKGNMQLTPRFDHTTRMAEFGTLIAPTDENVAKTYTKLYRPEVYEYLIIDNDGNESLRYKTGGDLKPQTPDHFRSPLATNFKYYATATKTGDTYSDITDKIEESLDGATLTENAVGNKVVYVRYEYDEEADDMNMLKGNWLTMQLNGKNAIYNDGIKQASGEKPATIDEDDKQWQWKFAHNSQPDPYAIYIYNRSQDAGTKAISDRFALLYHSEGDYALAKAGVGSYTYSFLNGNEMNTTTVPSVAVESDFTPTSGTFDGTKSQVTLYDDVTHTFTYTVYTNEGVEAISATQSQEDVYGNDWKPVLPVAARTPLLNLDQYRYYEKSLEGDVAEEDTLKKALSHLYGLYKDVVNTHYTAYDSKVSKYLVPNVRNDKNTDPVARHVESNDAPIGLDGKRPYNIIWYQDNMMKSNGTSIACDPDQDLQAVAAYEWEFDGNDPYAIKIKSVGETNKYIHKATGTTTELNTTATPFMLLNRDGYDYGVFAKTGDATTMLSGHGDELTTGDPEKFIPFALSTYKVVYHLIIANIGNTVSIPYAELDENGNRVEKADTVIDGSTLRDLTTRDETGSGHFAGDYYQLGSTIQNTTYCYDAGHVSLGDAFKIPQAFSRPNVSYEYYIGGVYNKDWTNDEDLNNEYKGLKMTNMGEDAGLLDKIVWVNVVYHFMGGLDTNSGSDFVERVNQNKWYTFETSDATPRLAEYSDGLKTVSGYATHYTNDFLWTPVGDPYGFKMYNRYIQKNLVLNKVMSTENFTDKRAIKMVNDSLTPHLPANSVYELLANSSTTSGYFRVHPVVNKDGAQYYMYNNSSTGAMTLETTPTEWAFGLSEEVMRPYYEAAGYIGGLNDDGKDAYEAALNVDGELAKLMALQDVVYNHDNDGSDPSDPNYIVHYTPGYYRLHSQPGSSDITTPRYMSGYTHALERDVNGDNDEADAIPLHFYEVEKYDINNPTFKDLRKAGSAYTETPATRGDIPLVTVDKDPASIFYFPYGSAVSPTSKISTQGLYVKDNKMTATAASATSFTIVDIGAGIVALQNGVNFLKYAQNEKPYEVKLDNTASTVESARWCMQPVQKNFTAGAGEMPLKVVTNYGGDEYYYTTFYAPFDVLLTSTNDVAYIVPSMTTATKQYLLHPKKIGEVNTGANADNDQFIPANTPVIIRTKNTGGEVTMALPTTTPSSHVSCVFSGEYLEQMLDADPDDSVFVFGRSYTHSDEFTYEVASGIVTPAGLELDKGVGFYINANNNRESNATKTMWTRNNKYVYGNKIYYRAAIANPSTSRETTRGIDFIPVVFDMDEEEPDIREQDDDENGGAVADDICVYDLQGRIVATEQQVKEGTWRNQVPAGVYILRSARGTQGGRKVFKK